MNKFKIGDRVKVKSTGEINTLTETYLIKHERKGHLVNDIYGTIDTYFKLGNSYYRFLEEELELVQTSEQIAVEQHNKIVVQKIYDFLKEDKSACWYTAHEIEKMLDVDESDKIEFQKSAVEKFKEELKANIKDTINIIENSINPTNSEFKKMLRLSRLEAYEEVLKLLESEDK